MKDDVSCCRDAISCQDACNPRAVARLLVELVDAACDRADSTYGAIGDSSVYLVMDKLASLGLYVQAIPGNYHQAYATCKAVVKLGEKGVNNE